MNALEEFYLKLDENDWDTTQDDKMITSFVQIIDILHEQGLSDIEHLAEINYKAIHYIKSPEDRYAQKDIQTISKDGWEVPFQSSVIIEFSEKDLSYLYDRFKVTKNVFAKTQYGLVLYYSKRKQDNEFVVELVNTLFSLLKSYIDKLRLKTDNNLYVITHIRPLLINTFYIAKNRKENVEMNNFYKSLIDYIYETHQNWEIIHDSSIVIAMIVTDLAVEYANDFNSSVNLKKTIDKNWEIAKSLSDKDAKEPLYIIDPTIQLCEKLKIDNKCWKIFKAQQYEKIIAVFFENNKNMFAMSYIEKTLKIYKELKDIENTNRLEQQYQQMRSATQLNDAVFDISVEDNERIDRLIKKEVLILDEDGIIKTLLSTTPFLLPLAQIREVNKGNLASSSMFTVFHNAIYDKFGNVIDQLNLNGKTNADNDEIKENFSLNQIYRFHLQIALQTLTHFFIEAFRADKISAEGILRYLKNTWIGEDFIQKIYGKEITVSHLKSIESGLNVFFRELTQSKNDSQYLPDLISATDSLILKCEYLLRELAGSLKIPTFKPKDREPGIVMEKTLDVILKDLKDKLLEDDRFFIKYILTEKAGYNLRNEIAHGLMYNIEYGFGYPILAIIIILKLSKPEIIKH